MPDDSDTDASTGPQLPDAVRDGLRRAGAHWIRAGYEMVAGVGALLDEIVSARKAEDSDSTDSGSVLERIELD